VQVAFALALGSAFAAHATVSWALTGFVDIAVLAIDGALLLLALVAGTVHAQQLARDRRRHVVVQELASAFASPRNVQETTLIAASLFVDAGLASAALVAIAHAPGDGERGGDTTILTPVARVGFPPEEPEDELENSVTARAFASLSIARELPEADRWLFGLGGSLGPRPVVARVPLRRGDELLGALLLVSRKAGVLHDRRLLETVASMLGAALDNARLYEATFAQTRDLEAQDARRREFLYAISHELRTPLTSIRAFAELLTEQRTTRGRGRTRATDEEEEQLFASLARGVDRLSDLVEDLLRLGRAEEVPEDVEIGPLDARAALESAAAVTRPAIMQRAQSLSLDLPEEPVWVLGETRTLDHVLVNLLSNASRHTPEHGRITARVEAANGSVRFEVSDSGPGIEAADRERIFEPFFRVRRAGAPVPGSGLGLAVARRSVEQLGGRIWVEDREDGERGARFRVELHAALAAPEPEAPARSAAPASHAKRPPRPGSEDEQDAARQLQLDLHERGRTGG
jgi:signal transduction histidine kinase